MHLLISLKSVQPCGRAHRRRKFVPYIESRNRESSLVMHEGHAVHMCRQFRLSINIFPGSYPLNSSIIKEENLRTTPTFIYQLKMKLKNGHVVIFVTFVKSFLASLRKLKFLEASDHIIYQGLL